MTRLRMALVGVTVIALAAAAIGVAVHRRNVPPRPPFGPERIHASATLRLTGWDEAKAFVQYPPHPNGGQLVLGQVAWEPPSTLSDGYFEVLVLDKRSHRKPNSVTAKAANGAKETVGPWCCSGFVLYDVETRYPWLRGAGDPREGNVTYTSVSSFSISPQAGGTTFVAHFLDPAKSPEGRWATAPVEISELLVALVFIKGRHIYWAQRLHG